MKHRLLPYAILVLGALIALRSPSASAHHSFAAEFDGSKRANARTVTTADGKTLGAASSGEPSSQQ